jgi:alanine racemase
MDVTTIDLSGAPHLSAGDAVTLLAAEAGSDAMALASLAEMIPYELLCGIGQRVRRVWKD